MDFINSERRFPIPSTKSSTKIKKALQIIDLQGLAEIESGTTWNRTIKIKLTNEP